MRKLCALAIDRAAKRLELRIARAEALEQRCRVADRGQRVAQLVREHGNEIIDSARGELERGSVPLLRQVLRHLREPVQASLGIVERGEHDPRPELRSVLAYAPALVLDAAGFPCDGKLAPRLAALDILGREKARE